MNLEEMREKKFKCHKPPNTRHLIRCDATQGFKGHGGWSFFIVDDAHVARRVQMTLTC
jgi:hypothetical protein